MSLCFHCRCTQYKLHSYQRQTVDQPAKNNGTLYQLSVAPVVPPCLDNSFLTRQPMFVYNNIGGRSYKICCSGKSISIAQSLCVFHSYVPGMQYTCATANCVLSGSTIFSTLSHKRQDFLMKKHLTQNVCFDIVYKFFLIICNSENKWVRYVHKCT